MSAVTARSSLSAAAASFFAIATVVVAVGVAGSFDGWWLNRHLPYRNAGNWLFGLLLCLLVLLRSSWRSRRPRLGLPTGARASSRELSRMVYLVLYLVVGTIQLLGIGRSLGSFEFETPRGLQAYLAYLLGALILARAFAKSDPPRPIRVADLH